MARQWILTLNIHLSFWLGRDLVTMGPWLLLCLVPSPRCCLAAAVEHLSWGRNEEDLSKSGVRLGLAPKENPRLSFSLCSICRVRHCSETHRLLCLSWSSHGEVLTGAGCSKVCSGCPDEDPVGHPVGHPSSGEPLTPALCHLLPFSH